MVDRLVAKKMVTKYGYSVGNREVIIKLTDKGYVVYGFYKELDKVNY